MEIEINIYYYIIPNISLSNLIQIISLTYPWPGTGILSFGTIHACLVSV